MSDSNNKKEEKKPYLFGEIKEYDLEKIEAEVLQESVYLDVFAGSDVGFKESIETLSGTDTLNKLLNLGTYKFNYKTNEFPDNKFPQGRQFGFMAQEVENQFPELIKKDENNMLFVNYLQMIPILAETIKELNSKIEKLEAEIKVKK